MKMRHFDPERDLNEVMDLTSKTMRDTGLLRVTAAQISRRSSLPVIAAEEALLGLTRTYPAILEVDADGELVFEFVDLVNAVEVRSGFKDYLEQHKDALGMYLTLFVVAPLAFLFSFPALGLIHASTYYQGLVGTIISLLGILALPFAMVTVVGTLSIAALAYLVPFFGSLLCFLAVHQLMGAESLLAGLAQFLGFGAIGGSIIAYWASGMFLVWQRGPRPELRQTLRFASEFFFGAGPSWGRDNERIVELLRKNSGVVSTGDLMLHFGISRAEAQRGLTRILLNYGGDIQTTAQGAILYHFPIFSGPKAVESRSELEPPKFFGSNLKWLQVMIWGSFIFGMITCVANPNLKVFPTPAYILGLPTFNDAVMQGFGAWPTLVLGVLFAIRYVIWRHRMRAYQERLPRIELLKKIFESPQGFTVGQIDTQLLASLGGTIDEEADTPDGELYLHFPEVELEMAAARETRSANRE